MQSAVRPVTVLSHRGWRSEVLATAVLVAGVERGRELIERTGASAFVIDAAGDRHQLGGLEQFVRGSALSGQVLS